MLPKDPLQKSCLLGIGQGIDTIRDNQLTVLLYKACNLGLCCLKIISDLSRQNCNEKPRLFCAPFVLQSIIYMHQSYEHEK